MLWQVDKPSGAKRREQLFEGGVPQEQLHKVLAELGEQHIKAANDADVVN